MQDYLQLYFVSYNPVSGKFEYVSNEFLMPPQNPDQLVQKLTESNYPDISDRYLVQTTSWHYEEASKVYLTYMIYSDYYDFINVNTLNKITASNGSWVQLRPEKLESDEVLSHGLRQLSYLIIRDRPPKWMLTSSIEKFVKMEKELAKEVASVK